MHCTKCGGAFPQHELRGAQHLDEATRTTIRAWLCLDCWSRVAVAMRDGMHNLYLNEVFQGNPERLTCDPSTTSGSS